MNHLLPSSWCSAMVIENETFQIMHGSDMVHFWVHPWFNLCVKNFQRKNLPLIYKTKITLKESYAVHEECFFF